MQTPFDLGSSPQQLDEDDLEVLKSCWNSYSRVDRGAEICTSSSQIHVILEGWAGKYRTFADGRRQIVQLHLAGELCDIDRLFCAELAYGVRALSPCQIATISIDRFKRAADENSSIRNLFWSLTVLENVALVEHMTDLGGCTARERTARFLCDVAARLEPRGCVNQGAFSLAMTQADLAEYLGLSLVHTHRSLQSLNREEIIRSHGASYTILDAERLRKAAALDTALGASAARAIEAAAALRANAMRQRAARLT